MLDVVVAVIHQRHEVLLRFDQPHEVGQVFIFGRLMGVGSGEGVVSVYWRDGSQCVDGALYGCVSREVLREQGG